MKKFLKSTIYRHFFKPLFWRIFSKYRNNFDIFCFHRVVPKEKFDQLTYEEKEFAVTTDFFDSFLSFASSRYKFCSLDYGISNLKTNNLLCHITFDDGYKDNLDYALPILKKFNVPATIYIADGIIDRKHLLLNHMCTSKIDEFLTWCDVKKLDADELIEIGGHTSSHARLSDLSNNELIKEIEISKMNIESNLGREINHFAYPYGGKGTYTSEAIKIIKNAGYKTAVTAICKKADYENELYELPRYFVTHTCSEKINLSRFSGISNILNHQLLP